MKKFVLTLFLLPSLLMAQSIFNVDFSVHFHPADGRLMPTQQIGLQFRQIILVELHLKQDLAGHLPLLVIHD